MNASAPTRISTEELLKQRDASLPRGMVTAHPVIAERAEGAWLWDRDGRKYLDFVGGIGVLNLGHNHPDVVDAVKVQLEKVSHTAAQVVMYEPYLKLAAKLNTLVGKGEAYKSLFVTTGAEAVENAVKIARAHTNRPGVIAFTGGFHGRTLLGVSLTGFSAPYKQNFGPFAPDIYHARFPDAFHGVSVQDSLDSLQQIFDCSILPERVAAILIEPVQGDGGFREAPKEFLQALRRICDEKGIVLIIDEIQTGFGRTGKLFAHEAAGVKPDLMTVAKSLAGGLPLAGVVGRADIMDAPLPGGLGGTYGGNALACAAALGVLKALESGELLKHGEKLGEILGRGLDAICDSSAIVGHVRGIGYMRAIEIVTDKESREPDADRAQKIIDAARERGLLIIKCGVQRNIVRFLPPLTCSEADMNAAIEIVREAVSAH